MNKQALIVHSDQATQILLEQWIRGEGYAARSVRSGRDAIDVAHRVRLDLIILDRQAPPSECSDVILSLVTDPRSASISIAFINAEEDLPPIVMTSRTIQ